MRPSERARRRLALAGAMVLLLAVAALFGPNAGVILGTRARIHGHPGQVPRRAVAIVPGASVRSDGTPSGALEARLQAALALYRAGRVGRVLVSGIGDQRWYDEVSAMARWFDARGVPARDVFLDRHGRRTLDTMQRAAEVYRVADAVVCTQRYHLPRALFLADRAGIDAVGLAAGSYGAVVPARDRVREFFARIRAVLDVYLLDTPAAVLGPPVPIAGDGRATRE